ncbi:MAG TPA: peptidase inhibitor family I36 protein [Solirubrobacteraceae bacterium]|jgi:hypothetical protein|nr:peptidase inhibitor family I36 protein [Solirubrobacteraceae bacterium]
MRAVQVDKKIFLGMLVTLALFAGALFTIAPKASAAKSECPANSVCIWEKGSYSGTFSRWAETNNGCHNHEFNLTFKSGWNNTNLKVTFGDFGSTPPGESFTTSGLPFEGAICW